jgi:iron complex outermembrane recepter protein
MNKLPLISAVSAIISLPSYSLADDDTERKPKNRLLEEVVVTARKREESVQDVPIAISAFSAEKLDAVGIVSAQQLDKITPGLVFANTLGFNIVFLRGVGTDAYLPAADPSVPIYIDDVNVLPTQGSVDTLGNISRVEVLKGPQGTLFGRNALGGAIRIITKAPDVDEFYGNLKVGGGNFNSQSYSAFVNVPVTDNIALAISGFSQEQDPYYTITNGFDLYDSYSRGARVSLLWRITDYLDVTLTGSKQKSSSYSGLVTEGTQPGGVVCAICTPDPELDYEATTSADAGSITEQDLVALDVNWKLPWFSTKLILSDQFLDVPSASTDLDGTAAPLVTASTTDEYGKQRTAEFRIISDEDTPFSESLSWVAGLYYLEAEGGYNPVKFSVGQNLLTAIPGAEAFNDQLFDLLSSLGIQLGTDVSLFSSGILETQSASVYAQGSYTFLDDFEFTLGLRYDEESRTLNNSKLEVENPLGGGRVNIQNFEVPEINTNRVSPRVSLKWSFDEASQIYASYAVGFLSPTYNSVNFLSNPDFVEQEESNAYEIGIKTELFSGALKLEGALFYTQRSDIISAYTTIVSGVAVRFYNAGDGEIKGAEFSLQAQPFPSLNPGFAVLMSGSFLESEYGEFLNGRGYDEDTGTGFGPNSVIGQPARDFTGNTIVNTPTFSGTATIQQTINVGSDSSMEFAVDTYYNSGFFFTPQNSKLAEQPSYQLFSARVSYFYDPWGLQVTAFGQNLTEPEYFSSVFQFDSGTTYQLAPPKAYGLRVKYDF